MLYTKLPPHMIQKLCQFHGCLDLPSPDKYSGTPLLLVPAQDESFFFFSSNKHEQRSWAVSTSEDQVTSFTHSHRGKLSAWVILQHKLSGTGKHTCTADLYVHVSNHSNSHNGTHQLLTRCLMDHLCAVTLLVHAGRKGMYTEKPSLSLWLREVTKYYERSRLRPDQGRHIWCSYLRS